MKKIIKVTARDIARAVKKHDSKCYIVCSDCIITTALRKYKIFKDATVGYWQINFGLRRTAIKDLPESVIDAIKLFDADQFSDLKPFQFELEIPDGSI